MILRQCEGFSGIGSLHGFSERSGGVSDGSQASLDLAIAEGEHEGQLLENWRRAVTALRSGWGVERVAVVRQVHGNVVLTVARGSGPGSPLAEADAMVTSTPGVILAIRTADCVPILVSDGTRIGAIHAGWRGVAAGIVGETLQHMSGSISAVVGPHIGAQSFEVGPEVVQGIVDSGVPRSVVVCGESRRGRPLVDLYAVVRAQLLAFGASEVRRVEGDTFTDSRLFSYRRDHGRSGRMVAMVAMDA